MGDAGSAGSCLRWLRPGTEATGGPRPRLRPRRTMDPAEAVLQEKALKFMVRGRGGGGHLCVYVWRGSRGGRARNEERLWGRGGGGEDEAGDMEGDPWGRLGLYGVLGLGALGWQGAARSAGRGGQGSGPRRWRGVREGACCWGHYVPGAGSSYP